MVQGEAEAAVAVRGPLLVVTPDAVHLDPAGTGSGRGAGAAPARQPAGQHPRSWAAARWLKEGAGQRVTGGEAGRFARPTRLQAGNPLSD